MIEAVLFDWNNTLVQFTWDDDLLAEGHRAALGRDDGVFTARYRELMLGDGPQRPYVELLRELGVDDPDAFIDAEHEVWRPAHAVLGSAHAMLDSLRGRGIRTGLVANAWPEPARVLRASRAALAAWLAPAPGHALEDHLYIVDPRGDWMMRVPVDPEPARLKSDMDKLLRASASWDRPGR